MKGQVKSLRELISRVDFFGHPTELYFNKDKNKRQSAPGGIISIFILFYMMLFVLNNVNKL